MASYLTTDEFKTRTLIPGEFVDAIEAVDAGWTLIQLEEASAWIDSRLRKRYAAPFSTPYPVQVLSWLTKIVTIRCLLKGGVRATDEQFVSIEKDADSAKAEILDASNGDAGLFDLPLRSDTTATGISKGGPFGYSEQSPYVWASMQRSTGRSEDSNGRGT
jgi:phage gp36-like protein